jgi:hypothetical protein
MSFEQEKFSVTKMMNNIPKKRPFSSALRDNSKLIMYTFERAGYTVGAKETQQFDES